MQSRNNRKEIRLNRYLAQCGLGSRRECDSLISTGKIFINGEKLTELGIQIDPDNVIIEYKGKVVKEIKRLEYIAYHKSRGTMVTARDPQGRTTIYEAIKKRGFNTDHLKYIGRLDRNSEGLLLLTNDGDMIHALTHPRFHIKKVYQVKINKHLREEDAETMVTSGVTSEGQQLRAGAISTIHAKTNKKEYWYEVDLYEGKNRQIRRMFECLGYEVIRLKRTQFSVIKLGDLKRGMYRYLDKREIKALKNRGYRVRKRKIKISK